MLGDAMLGDRSTLFVFSNAMLDDRSILFVLGDAMLGDRSAIGLDGLTSEKITI
jgi:hypothetical protein